MCSRYFTETAACLSHGDIKGRQMQLQVGIWAELIWHYTKDTVSSRNISIATSTSPRVSCTAADKPSMI
jgi:hypothetical protein